MRRAALLFVAALELVALCVGLELMGARASLGVLSGTLTGHAAQALLALVYVAVWLLTVVGAPALLLAAALQWAAAARVLPRTVRWLAARRRRGIIPRER